MNRTGWPALLLMLLVPAGAVRADAVSARAALDRLAAASGPAAGAWGAAVVDARTGAPVYDAQARTPRVPASSLKLLTTAAAWLLLGPDYRFVTSALAATGPDGDGALAGDLVVLGTGDPTLTVEEAPGEAAGKIDLLAREVSRAGVRRIDGDVVLDAGAFTGAARHPDWPDDQMWRWYCAPVAALTVARSCIVLRVEPGAAAGQPGRVTLRPPLRVLRVVNETVTVENRKDHRIIIDPPAADGSVRVRGGVLRSGGAFDGEIALPDPVAAFGDAFRQALVRAGVAVRGDVVVRPGASRAAPVRLAAVETPLPEIVEVANRRSQNLFAECLLRALGREKGTEGSFAGGSAAAAAFAVSRGVPEAEVRPVDGSGLSRGNRVSPRALVSILRSVYTESEKPEKFLATLAAGGDEEGSLRRRLKELGNDVRAKTGTINGVSALAGYVRAKSGRVVAFAVLVNDPKMSLDRARAFQDEVCRILRREL